MLFRRTSSSTAGAETSSGGGASAGRPAEGGGAIATGSPAFSALVRSRRRAGSSVAEAPDAFGAMDHDLFAVPVEEGEVDPGEFVVRLPLVHLLLDAAAAFDRVSHVLVELLISWRISRVQDLEQGAEGLLDALLVAAFDSPSRASPAC